MRIDVSTLKQYALNTLTDLGCHPAEAEAVSEHLIEANLCGHDSHGVGMLPFYVDICRRGTLKVNQVLSTVQDYGAILQYDAHRGFGQYLTNNLIIGDMNAVMTCVLIVGVIFIALNLLDRFVIGNLAMMSGMPAILSPFI